MTTEADVIQLLINEYSIRSVWDSENRVIIRNDSEIVGIALSLEYIERVVGYSEGRYWGNFFLTKKGLEIIKPLYEL